VNLPSSRQPPASETLLQFDDFASTSLVLRSGGQPFLASHDSFKATGATSGFSQAWSDISQLLSFLASIGDTTISSLDTHRRAQLRFSVNALQRYGNASVQPTASAVGNGSDFEDMEMPPSSQQTNIHKEDSPPEVIVASDRGNVHLGSISPPSRPRHEIIEEEGLLARMLSSDVVLARMAGPDGHRARLRLQQASRLQRTSSGAGAARDTSGEGGLIDCC
jgi:hypothetical protein